MTTHPTLSGVHINIHHDYSLDIQLCSDGNTNVKYMVINAPTSCIWECKCQLCNARKNNNEVVGRDSDSLKYMTYITNNMHCFGSIKSLCEQLMHFLEVTNTKTLKSLNFVGNCTNCNIVHDVLACVEHIEIEKLELCAVVLSKTIDRHFNTVWLHEDCHLSLSQSTTPSNTFTKINATTICVNSRYNRPFCDKCIKDAVNHDNTNILHCYFVRSGEICNPFEKDMPQIMLNRNNRSLRTLCLSQLAKN